MKPTFYRPRYQLNLTTNNFVKEMQTKFRAGQKPKIVVENLAINWVWNVSNFKENFSYFWRHEISSINISITYLSLSIPERPWCIISGGHLRLGWVQRGGCLHQSVGPSRLTREHSYKGEVNY